MHSRAVAACSTSGKSPVSARAWPQPQLTESTPSSPGIGSGTAAATEARPRPSCPLLLFPNAYTRPSEPTASVATPDAAQLLICRRIVFRTVPNLAWRVAPMRIYILFRGNRPAWWIMHADRNRQACDQAWPRIYAKMLIACFRGTAQLQLLIAPACRLGPMSLQVRAPAAACASSGAIK